MTCAVIKLKSYFFIYRSFGLQFFSIIFFLWYWFFWFCFFQFAGGIFRRSTMKLFSYKKYFLFYLLSMQFIVIFETLACCWRFRSIFFNKSTIYRRFFDKNRFFFSFLNFVFVLICTDSKYIFVNKIIISMCKTFTEIVLYALEIILKYLFVKFFILLLIPQNVCYVVIS